MQKINQILTFILVLFVMSCSQENSIITFHKSHEPTRQNTPFSDAVETDDFLFLAGQIGRDHAQGHVQNVDHRR